MSAILAKAAFAICCYILCVPFLIYYAVEANNMVKDVVSLFRITADEERRWKKKSLYSWAWLIIITVIFAICVLFPVPINLAFGLILFWSIFTVGISVSGIIHGLRPLIPEVLEAEQKKKLVAEHNRT